ncbi:MAG: aminotransferase class III-fold pyridoxal phosphate-dependent enzyme [Verrucomicrobiales bacterium]|nr:aminotransferase class III-fold pyridoxal phosphate-dependent enzyme [Verrucomicrobiales bacterium]
MKKEEPSLVADAFHNDPAVREAKRILMERLGEHQMQLDGVRQADPERAKRYQEMIAELSAARSGNLYFPYIGSGIGNGALVELGDGSVKYDFISGIGVHHFGHSNPKLVAAGIEAGLSDTVMQGNLQQNAESVEFSRLLLEAAPNTGGGFDHCFLTSTGVMAGENALKIAFQKNAPANRVLAFEHCFAGRTITFSQITDKPAYRQGVPLTVPVDYVPFDPDSALKVLNDHIARYPGQHAGMIFELVQGEGGFNVGSEKLFRPLMERCREAGISVLVDEVQTFARTPALFATEFFGLGDLVDMIWIGKASQVCATLFRKDHAPQPGLLSQTFTAGSGALAAGCVILRELRDGKFFGPDGLIQKYHDRVTDKLRSIESEDPDLVSGPFGIGVMIAFTPFGGDPAKVSAFVKKLFDRGVIAFVAGSHPMRVRFLLPVGGLTVQQLEDAWEIIEDTLREENR